MTPKRATKLLPIIKAYANGAEIQIKSKRTDAWIDCKEPEFTDDFEYRIKPHCYYGIFFGPPHLRSFNSHSSKERIEECIKDPRWINPSKIIEIYEPE